MEARNPLELESVIHLTFSDKGLLQRALTHRSYLNENPELALEDNERLEFLGDAVLDFLVGEHLYHHFPEMDEGGLTNLRAALVKTDTLARFAGKLQLGRYLLMGRGEAESGGRKRPSLLAAAFEALVGAIYLDHGLDTTRSFIEGFIVPELKRIREEELEKDAKSLLQELSQAHLHVTPAYRTVAERGPDHAKEFTVEVLLGQEVYGKGVGRSKHAAEQAAAQEALARLQRELERRERGRELPAPVTIALLTVFEKLRGLDVNWLIAGSTGSVLQGLPLEPRDLDILTDAEGARQIARALAEFNISPLAYRETPQYASYLARFRIEGVPVEVIGDLVIKGRGSSLSHARWRCRKNVTFAGVELPVLPLEAQLISYFLTEGKEERAQYIAAHLRKTGYDEKLLKRLLDAQRLPPSLVEEIYRLLGKPCA